MPLFAIQFINVLLQRAFYLLFQFVAHLAQHYNWGHVGVMRKFDFLHFLVLWGFGLFVRVDHVCEFVFNLLLKSFVVVYSVELDRHVIL